MAYQNKKVKARQVVTTTTQTKELGIATNVPMGEWNSATQYRKLNTVRSHNATYQAKKDNQGVEPTVTTGWQEVWQVVAYDGGAVNPDGTYPNMSVGNATNAQNDGTGTNIANQFSDINGKIPSTASAENQLADKAFVNSSINAMAAFYITYTAIGDKAFPTRADLLNATTFYSGGKERVPTQNDYAIVLADESQQKGVDGSYPTTRYSYQGGTYPNGQWDFQYVVNNTSLTQAQVDAINSGITKELVGQIIANGEVPTKNLYNLGAFDTYVSGGDGTGTIRRGTIILNKNNLTRYFLFGQNDRCILYTPILQQADTDLLCKINIPNVEVYGLDLDVYSVNIVLGRVYTQTEFEELISGICLQIKKSDKYAYEEQVIEDQPIRPANQEECSYWHKEWQKGLNLIDNLAVTNSSGVEIIEHNGGYLKVKITNDDSYMFSEFFNQLPEGIYTISTNVGRVDVWQTINGVVTKKQTFVVPSSGQTDIHIEFEELTVGETYDIYLMLVKGTIPYPYQPYYGEIARVADVVQKAGDTMTGSLTLPSLISAAKADVNPTEIIPLPRVPYELIDPTHDTTTYLQNLLKWICTNYPNKQHAVFIGTAYPNSVGEVIIHIYDTSVISSEGLPGYAMGLYQYTSGDILVFGTNAYVWYIRQIQIMSALVSNAGSGTISSSKTLPSLSVGEMGFAGHTATASGSFSIYLPSGGNYRYMYHTSNSYYNGDSTSSSFASAGMAAGGNAIATINGNGNGKRTCISIIYYRVA